MRITYFGVRGSTPVSGKAYAQFGGNTTSVLIEAGKEVILIDAGTGIRNCGNYLISRNISKIHILFTHTHWDHIQGFPFFAPAYKPNTEIIIYGESKVIPLSPDIAEYEMNQEEWTIKKILAFQQLFMYFPVSLLQMGAKMSFYPLKAGEVISVGEVDVLPFSLLHPNGSLGFRFCYQDKIYVFCTDVEHNQEMSNRIIEIARGADIFAYDSQYTPEEYLAGRVGWGHSTYEEGATIAQKAGVKNYHMIHHDPSHDDKKIFEMEEKAQALFSKTFAIRENDVFEIP